MATWLPNKLCPPLAPAQVSYLRGLIWQEAGDPQTAALFLQHAARLAPENKDYLLTLGSLNLTAQTTAEPHG